MKYRLLGRTGVQVSQLCLGSMMFGSFGNPDRVACARIIHAALDAGINFIDTADVYSGGESEQIVGEALRGRRDNVILATKVHHPMGGDINEHGSSRRWIVRAVDDSLRRLKTDWIDLYQLHRHDPLTDLEETMSALTDLVRAGKVRSIGSCTFPGSLIAESHWIAERRGYERFRCQQPPYSIFARGAEKDSLSTSARYGMGVITWSPLGQGWLSGRYRRGQPFPEAPRSSIPAMRKRAEGWQDVPQKSLLGRPGPGDPIVERKLDIIEELVPLAEQSGISLVHLAVAFVLNHPAVTSAIIGPRTMEHLTGQLGAVDVDLSAEVLDRIDELVTPGSDVNPLGPEVGYQPPEITDPWRRRRNAAPPRV